MTYQLDARARTVVPVRFRQFMRQQARWKRSWAREATILVRLIWRKPAPAAAAVYVSVMLPIAAPLVAARSLFVHPLTHHSFSLLYLLGVYAMALTYGLYYAACQPRYSSRWWYGIVFVGFYLAFLLWQTYWAIATLRTAKWGTRPATAGIATSRVGAAGQPLHRDALRHAQGRRGARLVRAVRPRRRDQHSIADPTKARR